jgi:hypothetical protein
MVEKIFRIFGKLFSMAVMIMKKKVEEIEPMDAGVRVRRGAAQYYKGKAEAEAQKPMASGSSAFKKVELKKPMLSEEEVTRVSNIKNSARASRVLDRMKKRKGMGNSTMM